MSRPENNNEEGMGEYPASASLIGGEAAALQQLHRLQRNIEEQGRRVGMAVNPIAEALDRGESVPPETMSHLRAQILKAHLQLDDLEQVLDALG